MTLTEEIFAQVRVMAPSLAGGSQAVLEALCRSSEGYLRARLRDSVTVESCKQDFITAAALMALASMLEIWDDSGGGQPEQITAGDLTLKLGEKKTPQVQCLRSHAAKLMQGYFRDGFSFFGV